MTTLTSDQTQAILAIVEEYGGSVHLSNLGAKLKKQGVEIEEKLRAAVESIPSLTVQQHPEIREKILVLYKDKEAEADIFAPLDDSVKPTIKKLYNSIIAAFCYSPEDDQYVYLEKKKPFKFSIQQDISANTSSVQIPVELLASDLSDKQPKDFTEEEAVSLVQKIKQWASSNNIHFESMLRKGQPKQGNALQRLLDAQQADVKKRIVIPGDIIEILINQV